jgi:antitoxin (DNA-binding transcriptional repressor) of toxin-antitoxin stability system
MLCDTMCNMKRANVRELHLRTSAIIKEVAQGGMFVIEKQGVPVAELRPVNSLPRTRRVPPDREAFLAKFPLVKLDSGRILEEDRS